MRRGVSLMMACACAVLAVMVAAWPPSQEPDLWIAFDGMSVDQNGDLVGTFRLLIDPQLFTEDCSLSSVPGKRIKIGDSLAVGHPWILEGMEKSRRMLFYEIRAVRAPQATRTFPRTLQLVAKEIEVDRSILRHRMNGQKIRITEVHRIVRPNGDRVVIYPEPSALDRVTGRPRLLTLPFVEEGDPPEPVRHDPGSGPLARLEPRAFVTTPYYELADERLVYWDSVNARLVVQTK